MAQEDASEQDCPTCVSHVSLGTNDFERSVAFYDKVMPTMGCKKLMAFDSAVAYGKRFPEFWIQRPIDGKPATAGNGTHVAFLTPSMAIVHAFYDEALRNGAKDEGKPGPRPEYTPNYYGAFMRDPDGHKIEIMSFDPSKMAAPHACPKSESA
jgi:catechol 2,3-dioxygenase-like lactoylglutathione lyase family enzyme